MSSLVRRSSHLSHHLAALSQQRGPKLGQMAACLGASNVPKVVSLIRAFQLGEPLIDHWLQKLVAAPQPDPTELRHCLEQEQAVAWAAGVPLRFWGQHGTLIWSLLGCSRNAPF